ncbi:MAG: hypothetical protein GYA21_07695 [Myxococcales bacterium]|nr:hypothetical protein [Myxococcales bacterium]
MRKLVMCLGAFFLMLPTVSAQEIKIHHGFLFFASEKYTLDEKTYSIWEEGHELDRILKENAAAYEKFESYKIWHTTAYVFTGLSLAAFVFGGVYYLFEKDMSEALGNSAGVIGFISGGALLASGIVFEFVAQGKITDAARIHNSGLMDEGPGGSASLVPSVSVGPLAAALTWKF